MHRIKFVSIIGVILIFALLDVTALNYVKIYDTKPDIFLIGVLFFALYGGLNTGASAGFSAGLIKDIFTGSMFGINILFLTLIGAFFGYNFSKFYREKPFVQFVLSFLLSIAYLFFYYILLKFLKSTKGMPFVNIGLGDLLATVGIPFALYTAVAAPFFFFSLRRIFRIKY